MLWRAAALILINSYLLLPIPCSPYTMFTQELKLGLTPTQRLCTLQHFSPASLSTIPLHLIAISILVLNCLPRTCRWASPQCTLRTARTPT